ncbi:hypothetical protein DPMN_051513 [Dreissena polymorpha]|uniref:Uncharacterized protein n=1 Tax=Dreissena polymorpha TaxID=45954 RepID=A0A9D4HND6_DREPO|nr:hypothetical protein DPMN_051513 [Dreissena polymorpha]
MFLIVERRRSALRFERVFRIIDLTSVGRELMPLAISLTAVQENTGCTRKHQVLKLMDQQTAVSDAPRISSRLEN